MKHKLIRLIFCIVMIGFCQCNSELFKIRPTKLTTGVDFVQENFIQINDSISKIEIELIDQEDLVKDSDFKNLFKESYNVKLDCPIWILLWAESNLEPNFTKVVLKLNDIRITWELDILFVDFLKDENGIYVRGVIPPIGMTLDEFKKLQKGENNLEKYENKKEIKLFNIKESF